MKTFAFLFLLLIFPGISTYAQDALLSASKETSDFGKKADLGLPPAATFTVTKTADTNDGVCDADCSLREAVAAAVSGDTIEFASPLFDTAQTVQVNGQVVINKSLTITGRGANLTTIQNIAGASATSRVILTTSGTTVSLSGLTITGGNVTEGGGGFTVCITPACGGGIANQGSLTITNSVVSGNVAAGNAFGGGISNSGTLILTNSTVANNSTSGNHTSGGGICIFSGTLNLTSSTVSGNSASGSSSNAGGGIYNSTGTINITNSTLSGNSGGGSGTSNRGGGIFNSGGTFNMTNSTVSGNFVSGGGANGGGIYGGGFRVRNTIVSGNSAATNPNLSGPFFVNDANIVDNEANVRLAPLGFYGGATMTMPLLSGSTAINAGNNCVLNQSCASFNAPVALSSDQRGAARMGNVDIGAFEANSSANGGTFRGRLPDGRLNSPYSFVLVPSNGTTNYAVTGGALPPGMNLTTGFAPSAVVSLTGTPTSGGVFNFSVTATNGPNTSVTDYSLNIVVPTAAGVSVSGRVLTNDGRGLRNASVILTDASGNSRTARTSSFGYFRFEDVEAGQTYVVSVNSKRFTFAPQVVFVGDEVTDLELFGEL